MQVVVEVAHKQTPAHLIMLLVLVALEVEALGQKQEVVVQQVELLEMLTQAVEAVVLLIMVLVAQAALA
jgi:hypothetical protein